MISATAYDEHVEQLFEVLQRVTSALRAAGIEYRVIGGLGVFLHVSQKDPLAARLTRDIDLAVDRGDLGKIADAVRPSGFQYRHSAGLDMLVDAAKPSAKSAVHLIMVKEKVRPGYLEPVPGFSPPTETKEHILLAPVADLLRMKLTSYRLKDRVHIQDLESVGLITPEVEEGLPVELRGRLAEIRATE